MDSLDITGTDSLLINTGMSQKKMIKYKLIDSEKDIAKSYEDTRGPKRSRLSLNEWQIGELEQSFKVDPYPDRTEKYSLFLKTKVPVKNIKTWFQNRRAREKHSYEERRFKTSQRGGGIDLESNDLHLANEFCQYYRY